MIKLDPAGDCDGDGIANSVECATGYNCVDTEGDGIPDYLDTDADNDRLADKQEGNGDCDADGIADFRDTDACAMSIVVPNLFTPNGDGHNDIIKPIAAGLTGFKYFKIYNRWGNLVFDSKDPNKGWDGRFNGKLQPQDTYIWIASGINRDGIVFTQKGLLSLIR